MNKEKVNYYGTLLMWLFVGGLLIMPFIFWPKAIIPYEIPRVWFILRWIELMVIVVAVGLLLEIETIKGDTKIVLLGTSFAFVAILSSIFGADLTKSLWGNYYRGDGLLTLIHLITLAIILTLFANKTWVNLSSRAISLGCLIIGLWVIFQGFQTYILGYVVSPWGEAIAVSFGNPNFLAGYLVVTLPFSSLLLKKAESKNERKLWTLTLLIQTIAILFTLSRAGILGLVIFAFCYLLLMQKQTKKSLVLIPIVALTILVSVFVNNYINAYNSHIVVAESRERIFTKAILAWKEKPLIGYGWANFDHAFESVDWPMVINDDVYVDKAHSQILETLTTTGSIGLIIYLTLISAAVLNLYKAKTKESNSLLLALILYVLHSQMNITSIAEEVIFWMIIGFSGVEWKNNFLKKL